MRFGSTARGGLLGLAAALIGGLGILGGGPAPLLAAPVPATRPVLSLPTGGAEAGWKASPDPAAGKVDPPPKPVRLPRRQNNAELIVAHRPSAFIAFREFEYTGSECTWLVDLRTGGSPKQIKIATGLQHPVISPGGQYLAGQMKLQPTGRGFDVFNFQTGQLERHFDSGEKVFSTDVWGFRSEEQVVTYTSIAQTGKIQVWNVKSGAVLCEIKAPAYVEAHRFAFSPGGKLLAVLKDDHLWVYDLTNGATLGDVDVPKFQADEHYAALNVPQALAFSPDGAELLGVFEPFSTPLQTRFIVWDVATGKRVVDRAVDRIARGKTGDAAGVDWSPDKSAWVWGDRLIARASGAAVFEIPAMRTDPKDHSHDKITDRWFIDPGHLLIVGDLGSSTLVVSAYTLPQEQIAKATAAASKAAAAGTRAGARDLDLPTLSVPDRAAMKSVSITGDAPASSDALVDAPPPAKRVTVNSLPLHVAGVNVRGTRFRSGEAAISLAAVFFSPPATGQALIAYRVEGQRDHPAGDPKDEPTAMRFERADLATGAVNTAEYAQATGILNFSRDGKFVLLRTGSDRLDVFAFAAGPGNLRHVVGFRPYDQEKNDREVASAEMLDPQHVVTANGHGLITLWSIDAPTALPAMPAVSTPRPATQPAARVRAVYQIANDNNLSPALSPTGKYLAVPSNNGPVMFLAATGERLASLAARGTAPLSFSPDGKRLAQAGGELTLWDLQTGRATASVAFKDGRNAPIWLPGPYLFAQGWNDDLLVDLDRGLVVWRYLKRLTRDNATGSAIISGQCDGRVWFVADPSDKPPYLQAVALPQDEAKKAAAAGDLESTLALKPGSKVAVDAGGVPGDENQRKAVVDALNRQLTAAGYEPAADAPNRLVASTTAGKSRTVTYQKLGGGPNAAKETVTLTEYTSKLSLLANGQSVWEQSAPSGSGNAPATVFLQGKQTLQQAIGNTGSFGLAYASLPRYVVKPEFVNGFGTSHFALKGIEPGEPPASGAPPPAPTPPATPPTKVRPRR